MSTSKPFAGSGNLIGAAAQAIETMIIDGAFNSGDKLTEKSLVERLGVSRSTVREALRKLESAGLIEIHEQRGAFVRSHSFEEVLEIFDLRCELTAYAARQLAGTGNREILARLDALIVDMSASVDAGDAKTYYAQNITFHDLLMQGSDNRRAARYYAALVREAHLHRPMQLAAKAALRRSHEEHRAIVAAIRDGDTALAESLARAHVANGKMRYIASFGRKAD